MAINSDFCGDNIFGFAWKELDRSNDNRFIFGQFQIIINGIKILDEDIIYNINYIFFDFKDDLKGITNSTLTHSDDNAKSLYLKATRLRGCWTYEEDDLWEYDDNITSTDELDAKIETYQSKYQTDITFGFEFNLDPDISNQGWKIFLFQNQSQTKDRLIYSKDNGRNVFEVQLELGTVAKVLSELPDL